MTLKNISMSGRDAFKKGVWRRKNPHKYGTKECREWDLSWMLAAHQFESTLAEVGSKIQSPVS